MAEDDEARPAIGEHLGRNIAGERSVRFGSAILAADLDRSAGDLEPPSARSRWRADRAPPWRRWARSVSASVKGASFGQGRAEAVHLPVSGD